MSRLLLSLGLTACFLLSSPFINVQTAQAKTGYQVQDYRQLLRKYVSPKGSVNYKGLKKNNAALARYQVYLSRLSPQTYQAWPKSEKIAFWINAYNAFTLKAILDAYPVSSIRKISGVWNRKTFAIMGKKMTLDQIEHQTLRKKFYEPRIHMALVCASKSCPFLRNTPFTGSQLNQQLNEQSRQFVRAAGKFKIDQKKGVVYLSMIFKWYGKDFVAAYKTTKYAGDKSQRASLKFLSQYANASQKRYLKQGKYQVKYLNYDWSLNGH